MFHLVSRLYEQISVIVSTNLAVGGRPTGLGDAEMTIALLDRLTNHCDIVENGNDSWRFRSREAALGMRSAEFIRASSHAVLREQAEHMDAPDRCSSR